MADSIDLTDLEVISRYSLAVRTGAADRADLIAALRADLSWLEGGRRPAAAKPERARAAARPSAPTAAPAKKTPAKKAVGRNAAGKKAAVKKSAAKKATRGR